MKKWMLRVLMLLLLAVLTWAGTIFADRAMLNDSVICICVEADSVADGNAHMLLCESLEEILTRNFSGIKNGAHENYIRIHLPEMQAALNRTLGSAEESTVIEFEKRSFDSEYFATSVPSGRYGYLLVSVGDGEGECAQSVWYDPSGAFGGDLCEILAENEDGFRFAFLDALGKIENFLSEE